MTLRLGSENRVWVKKVENKGKYGQLIVSTSRKDKKTDTWVYSSFYVKLVGDKSFGEIDDLTAKYIDGDKFENTGMLKKGFPINLKSVTLSNEPYEKEGKKIYQNMQLTCWEWEWLDGESKPAATRETTSSVDVDDDESFPFGEE
jgi:hypothetical protein